MTHLRRKMKHLHFVGIGGIGMSGIAELLIAQGFEVSGSDLLRSSITDHLESLGCQIFLGHQSDQVGDADVVVFSSAVQLDNPEIVEAEKRGIPVIRRAEMLAEVMRLKTGIAIAGTHGKTTTTSMIGEILTLAGLDPTVVVGGVMRGLGTNARLGKSELLVAEADEFDRSFLKLTPTLAVITNLEAEHLDTYETYENLREAFIYFANSVPFYGIIALCIDEPNLLDIISEIRRPIVTYGLSPQADIRGENLAQGKANCSRIFIEGKKIGQLSLPLLGVHNLRNALGAIAISRELEIPFELMQQALGSFKGVKRRFEKRGEAQGIEIYDDYAHHPTEVGVTLNAARAAFEGRIIAVFQPHLFSRAQAFFREFAQELLAADVVFISPIYPAREKPIEGVTAELIANQARTFGHKSVYAVTCRQDLAPKILELTKPGDIVITLGAGDIYKTSDELLALLEKRKSL